MHIRNQKDFWAGVMFIAFGGFFSGFGTQYTFGSAARMGPGYFPTVLGIVLMLLGLIVAIGGLSSKADEEKIQRFDWPTLLFILGPIVLFGLLLQPLGLVLSLFLLVVISSYASHEFKWRAAIINAIVLIAMSLAVFVWGLKLQFQLWPAFISG
jgi:Tripartite tricarboxylate transporter TctB family